MLEGLDDLAWGELTHAYGEAEDTPQLLRQAASADVEEARVAADELIGSVFHQGTVYPATVAAVPFFIELARHAPYRRADHAWTLGMLADPRHAYGAQFPHVQEAVAGQLSAIVSLLDDDDARVREAAAYAAAKAGTGAEPLWRRWQVETDQEARASLALALGETDARQAAPVLAEAVRQGSPPLRVAAAVAMLRAGLQWPQGTIPAVIEAIDAQASVHYCWARGGDWSDELLVASPPAVALDVLAQMLRAGNPGTRTAGLWAAGERCHTSRSAPAALVPAIVPLLADVDVHDHVIGFLRRAGKAAGQTADALAQAAQGFPAAARGVAITAAHQAVETLQRLGDPRWIDAVCAAAAQGHRARQPMSAPSFSAQVVEAIRDRLRREPQRADVLAGFLALWGTKAAAAVPELVAALPHAGDEAAHALLQLGHDDPAAVRYLRKRAKRINDLASAMAVWRIAGDADPAVRILAAILDKGIHQQPPDMAAIVGQGHALRPLLPKARALLTGTAERIHPQRERQILAARLVATDDLPTALPTVQAVLEGGNTPGRAAAELIADLVPAHPQQMAQFTSPLRERLGDRWNRVAAARALALLGVPTAELAEPLLSGITDYAGRFGLSAIAELRAVETIPALQALAAQDERLEMSTASDDVVWNDELLCDRISALIAKLSQAD